MDSDEAHRHPLNWRVAAVFANGVRSKWEAPVMVYKMPGERVSIDAE
jgi:hypothetical protein